MPAKRMIEMSIYYGEQDVLCPYYLSHDRTTILCEGFEDGMNVRQIFASGELRREAMKRSCFCGSWRFCRIAKAAAEKYAEEERKKEEGG